MKITKTFIIILLFIVFNIKYSYSQEKNRELRVNFSNFVSIGINTIDIKNFDKILIKNNYLPFSENTFFIGTGNRGVVDKLILGGEGNFSIEKKNINNFNNHINYLTSSTNIIGNIGYIFYEKNNLAIYPLLGIGLSRLSFDFIKNESIGKIDNILKNPDRGSRIENYGLILDIGLEGGYLIPIGKSENKKGGIAIGSRFGYILTLYQTGLRFRDFNIEEVPDISFNGFYIKFLAGFTGSIIPTLIDLL
ncbi:MAG: hypothetical protein KatS3mg068_1195 [Candidatus Sericytochromatia bacterium]|nr:MAG: hypothetical protein KatS3mg068_1195 [Candidatus Sericytochromatia bacterium]